MTHALHLRLLVALAECRDHRGTILLHFAKYIVAESAIHAKVLAVREGLLFAAAARWSSLATFFIESDSMNVVL